MIVYLDTHVLVWLFDDASRLSPPARRAIDRYELRASPAAVLEMEFLHELGRTRQSAADIVKALATHVGLRICDLPFRTVVDVALKEAWGRDPFDRLIVAQAKAAGAGLVSKDEKIRQNYAKAIW